MKTELRILVNSLHQLTQEDHIDELEGGVIDEAANALSCQASRIQQLEGEAKVLRDLLDESLSMIEDILKHNELELTSQNKIIFLKMALALAVTL